MNEEQKGNFLKVSGDAVVAGIGLMAILNMLACLVLLSVTGCVRRLYRAWLATMMPDRQGMRDG